DHRSRTGFFQLISGLRAFPQWGSPGPGNWKTAVRVAARGRAAGRIAAFRRDEVQPVVRVEVGAILSDRKLSATGDLVELGRRGANSLTRSYDQHINKN